MCAHNVNECTCIACFRPTLTSVHSIMRCDIMLAIKSAIKQYTNKLQFNIGMELSGAKW